MTYHRETRAVRLTAPAPGQPVAVPLYQTANFVFDDPAAVGDAMGSPDNFVYSGYANPTARALEDAMTDLEGGTASFVTGSGSGAVNAVFHSLLRHGDHVVAQRALYGGTVSILNNLVDRWGIEVTYIDGVDPDELRAAIRPTTRILHLETISNPIGHVPDMPALTAVARTRGIVTTVDNTFATPLLCRPIEHGADVVIHSATKYLGGHHDVVGGVAVFADRERYLDAWQHATRLGVIVDPFAAWLVLRGLKTLHLRVERQCSNAQYLAEQLAAHPEVAAVHHPGLPSHPSHERASKLLNGYGGTLAVDVPDALAFMRRLELVLNAPSLGGTETIVMHPATTSHRSLSPEQMRAAGVGPNQVRIALGVEHPEDIWADVSQALA
jgi:cystathionine beta-lyase/cystathionine gamma-synthase